MLWCSNAASGVSRRPATYLLPPSFLMLYCIVTVGCSIAESFGLPACLSVCHLAPQTPTRVLLPTYLPLLTSWTDRHRLPASIHYSIPPTIRRETLFFCVGYGAGLNRMHKLMQHVRQWLGIVCKSRDRRRCHDSQYRLFRVRDGRPAFPYTTPLSRAGRSIVCQLHAERSRSSPHLGISFFFLSGEVASIISP
ncbi:hypothetical protein B0T17DRAFT_19320 [Bombardia bombarda]|uniref:Uncharacterized protein n=1 Tax=Bombardia bombarda TaxID=252184 RepID=A0AA39XIU9_9PEZI|nr:hypothetical protein B0T17DRAFT_19320 [Bombardia bombarda]